jgi:hypothetical protein
LENEFRLGIGLSSGDRIEMGKVLEPVIHAMGEEWRQFYDETFLNPDPVARLEEQLRTLYGRGEINWVICKIPPKFGAPAGFKPTVSCSVTRRFA